MSSLQNISPTRKHLFLSVLGHYHIKYIYLSTFQTHVKFMYHSATRHISPNNPPTLGVLFLAAAVRMVREYWQCRRSESDEIETDKHQTFLI